MVFTGILHNRKEKSRNQISIKMISLSPIGKLHGDSIALWVLFLKLEANSRQMNNNEKSSIHGNLNKSRMELERTSS